MITVSIYTKAQQDRVFFTESLQGGVKLHFYDTSDHLPHADTEVISVFTDVAATREVMDQLPKLRLIAVRATGVDHIDIAAAKEKGITVAHVSGYGSTTVAEYTVTLLLMLTRQMTTVLKESARVNPDRTKECGIDVHGKTLGVLGTGAIGMGVARIARGFGMRVVGYDMFPDEKLAQEVGLQYADTIDELLMQSDIISLHTPLTNTTQHIIDGRRLDLMKNGAILLNTARGELVETEALIAALKLGRLRAAGLDVVEGLAAEERLRVMDNVIVTNHNAYNTVEAIERINQRTLHNIRNFIAGKKIDAI